MADYCLEGDFDRLVAYGLSLGMVHQLRRTRFKQSHIAMDVVDWYQPSHLRGPSGFMLLLEHEALMRGIVKRTASVITVSHFLGEHFSSQGVDTLVVPPLIEPTIRLNGATFASTEGAVHVAFAGSVGGKDGLTVRNLLLAAKSLNLGYERVVIHLVGPSLDECERLLRAPLSTVRGVVLHGRQPGNVAADIVAACDYSVLQRPPGERYARAGFPTKVVESWVLGTPVISNISSDLDRYLVDGVNGIVISSEHPEQLIEALLRGIDLRTSFDTVRIREWAAGLFAPQVHAARIHDFLAGGE